MEKTELRNKIESFKLFTLLSFVATFCVSVILGFAIYYAAGDWFGSETMSVSVIPLSVTLLYCLSSIFLGFFQKRAAVEEEDKLLLEKRKERKATFETEEDALFTASRTLNNYAKYAPYVISILSSLLITGLLLVLWQVFAKDKTPFPEKALQAAFIAFLLFAVSLFCGVFSIGQSRRPEFRWLRPIGVWFVLSAINLLAASFAVMLKNSELPLWDFYLSRIFMIICSILAIELLVNFIIEFYRPRVGAEERPLFESRFLSFFTEPGGFLRNVADTLDYQFGFQVSGTWIYVFLEKSLAPFLLIWFALLWLFTSLDEVAPGELGVRETFGVNSEEVLAPSVYLKWPWPIQKIRKIPVNQIQEIFVGPELKDAKGKEKRPDVVLWTVSHYAKEGRFLIATDIEEEISSKDKDVKSDAPVSMIAAMLPVQFKVRPDQVLDYAYKHENPVKTLKDISEKEITGYFASADMLKLMSSERETAIEKIKANIQQAADNIDLGVDIIAVAFIDAHPPIDDNELPQAFQEVVGAHEEKEAEIHDAKAYRARTIPQAEADALKLKLQAEAYKNEKTKVSKAEIKRFKDRMVGYRAMPEMYILNAQLDFLENNCKKVRKYIVPDEAQNDVYVINLEEKQRLDLLDIADLQEEKK